MSPSKKMPALFIGHGSPMNTLERNRYTDTTVPPDQTNA